MKINRQTTGELPQLPEAAKPAAPAPVAKPAAQAQPAAQPRTGNGGLAADIRGTFSEETEAELPSTALFRFGPAFAVGAALGTDWFPNQRTSLRVELGGRLWRMRTPTGLLSNRRVGKDDPRIEAYGTVDELNAVLGIARAEGLDRARALLHARRQQRP